MAKSAKGKKLKTLALKKKSSKSKVQKAVSKQQQAEVMEVYNAYWDNYLKGDVKAIASLLDDDYTQIGSAESEVFFNKQDAVKFLHDTINQVAGKAKMRNRVIKLEQQEEFILITELTDLYVMPEADWIFHSKFRASSLMKKTKSGWKFFHQHSSFPDIRAQEGENIAIEKIAAENLQLRDAVKRRTVELEHKNRELEIEAALEKVRAASSAMVKTEELSGVVSVMYKQFELLKVIHVGFELVLCDEAKGELQFWTASLSQNNLPECYNIQKSSHPFFKKQWNAWKTKKDRLVITLDEPKYKEFINFVFSQTDYKKFPDQVKKFIRSRKKDVFSHTWMKYGLLEAVADEALSDEGFSLLQRFAKVFEQTYTRFLDLQRAEAQAREAQIEAALERVRSRTMAMHKSDELAEVVAVFYEQLKPIGVAKWGCTIMIFNEAEQSIENWFSGIVQANVPLCYYWVGNEHWVVQELWNSWKAQVPMFNMHLKDSIKLDFDTYLMTKTGYVNLPEPVKNGIMNEPEVYFTFASTRYGLLHADDLKPITEENSLILQRFAKVFEQTYTRFLDLQKAEAQAREAQIQLSLERIRARAMAMHKSEELGEVATLLYKELSSLAFAYPFFNCGYVEVDEKNNTQHGWMTTPDGTFLEEFNLPLVGDGVLQTRYDAWKRKAPVFCQKAGGSALKNHIEFVTPNFGAEGMVEMVRREFPDPTFFNCGNFSHGYLHVITGTQISDDEEVLMARFTQTFEMTYKRFLDLQKAEAQTREAQIELAMERVRARSMAMHRSEELSDVVALLFEEIKPFGFASSGIELILPDEHNDILQFWMTSTAHNRVAECFNIPRTIHPFFQKTWKAWKDQLPRLTLRLEGQEKEKFDRLILTKTDFKRLPEEVRQFILNSGYQDVFSSAIMKHGLLESVDTEPISDEQFVILERFAKVFEQTYTRFLDLQKAEAQAREAKIEAALERIRARTMAMQKTDELLEVGGLLYKELSNLGVTSLTSGYTLVNKDGKIDWNYVASPEDGSIAPKPLGAPRDETKVMRSMTASWEKQEPFHVIELNPQETIKHQTYIAENLINFTLTAKELISFTPERLVLQTFNFEQGYLLIVGAEKLSDENVKMIVRFARVFEMTYKRFLDLQKAEAQAREAQVETSLERVRSRSLAMQKSEELNIVLATIFKEVSSLGLKLARGIIWIFHPQDKSVTWWASNPEAESGAASYHIPYLDHTVYRDIWQAWEERTKKYVYDLSGETKRSWDEILFTSTELAQLPKEAKAGMKARKKVYLHISFNEFGLLMLSAPEPLDEDSISIIDRFGRVFEQSYTRFNDIKQAEAQVREAEIQLALERVRARTMAMHKSEDLPEVVFDLFEQMHQLGFAQWGSAIALADETKGGFDFWFSTPANRVSADHYFFPNHGHAVSEKFWDDYKKQIELSILELRDDEKTAYTQWLFNNTPLGNMPENDKAEILSERYVMFSYSAMKYGFLEAISHVPMPTELAKTLPRFAKVFEQTYTRFLDLQKAEAQAREAEIQLALERIRARTMAMHKSEELSEVAALLFKQLKLLGAELWTAGFAICKEDELLVEKWMSSPITGQIFDHLFIPYNADHGEQSMYDTWKNKVELYSYVQDGKELKDIYDHLMTIPSFHANFQKVIDAGRPLPVWQKNHVASYKYGYLLIITEKEFKEEFVFTRFAKVFEQTYTRFLDLQKAEAQTREAQIEAALERVRSKTMAMHKSEQLPETAQVLFEQFAALGRIPDRIGIGIINEELQNVEWWVTDQMGSQVTRKFNASILQPTHAKWFAAWKEGKDALVIDLSGEELKEWIAFVRDEVKMPIDESKMKGRRVQHAAFFSQGYLICATHEPLAAEILQLLIRFAKVFNQTFTRFLDLQKAEAQAREAQIEASLERVRASAMAMHTSEDVVNATSILFLELHKLGIETMRCGILIIDESQTMEVWTATRAKDGQPAKIIGKLDMTLHPLLDGLFHAWKNKEESYEYHLRGQDRINYYNTLASIPIYSSWSQFINDPDHSLSAFLFEAGALYTFANNTFSDEIKSVMKRFTSVFALTFRRYQDLKKAEAQAREAQIEAALERVRSRSMGMQKSEELREVIQVIYEQFVHLNIRIDGAGFAMDYMDSDDFNFWLADPTSAFPYQVHIPYFDHPQFNRYKEAKEKDLDFYTSSLTPEERNKFFDHISKYIPIPKELMEAVYSTPGYETSHVVLKNVILYILNFSGLPFSEADNDTLMRFGRVFKQTYTRFNDLKQAEAQAMEAIKRASVDRVRAEIASMRTTADLERITPLIWSELTTLGVPFVRCGVFIMDDANQVIHNHLSSPDGKSIKEFRLPYGAPGFFARALSHWHEKKIFIDHLDKAAFAEIASTLVKQGAVASEEEYLSTLTHSDLHAHFLPFLQGMLYVANTASLAEEEINLVQSLADAFSTAYARYEDFNKLEAAKQQVDKTLVDLKQTQAQLVQSEKMASLGELTAGIAHEIQNPLNFVNNFSEVSNELIKEIQDIRHKTQDQRAKSEEDEILNDVAQNLEKINHHGKRAADIVKGMLQHSRTSSGQKELTDINALADEYLRLAYHGLRAKDKSFNAKFETDFDTSLPKVNVVPQDIGRAVLNLINNAFFAVNEKRKTNNESYEPTVTVSTKKLGDKIEIRVKDNGNGIPDSIKEKIFQPFFTTKPTGQGTGLGLSLSYDIVKAHGGELRLETRAGEGSAFHIHLPTNPET